MSEALNPMKRALAVLGLLQPTRTLRNNLQRHYWQAESERLTREYLEKNGPKLLQIGSAGNPLDGWLNGDIDQAPGTVYLNATREFPYPENAFDYAFSEHMIEHIDYRSGCFMLLQLRRVLKPDGVLRIVTPDLKFLLDLFNDDLSPLQQTYLEFACELGGLPKHSKPTFVLNNYVRSWGHQFIYDAALLERSLQDAGFRNIVSCKLNESDHDALRGLENDSRMPAGFLELESIVYEATK